MGTDSRVNRKREGWPLTGYFVGLAALRLVTALVAATYLWLQSSGDVRTTAITVTGVAVLLAGMWLVYRKVALPIDALSNAVHSSRAIGAAANMPVAGPREVARLGQEINELIESLNGQWAERQAVQERYSRLFDGSPLPMALTDTAGDFIDVNEAAARTFGYTRDEFRSLKGGDVFAPANEAERSELMSVRSRLEHDPLGPAYVHYGPVSLRKKDGSIVRARGTTYRVELDGKPAWVGVLEDVTRQEKLERQMKQAERLEAIGQLAGGISHDFNNLLAVILTSAASLKAGAGAQLADAEVRDVERINKAAQSAARLTRQLLAFARREPYTGTPVDVSAQIRDLTDLLRRTLGSHIVLTADLPDGVWPVRMDPGQLEQVIINLAVNARDAMGKGGRLAVTVENFDVDEGMVAGKPGLKVGRYIRLQVSDSGIGMDRNTLDHLFEPFFTTKPAGHGTGLGLATVYGIVKQLGGDVSAYSEPGMGTTFTILLPATEAPVETVPADPPPPRPKAMAGDATILVVEDYADLRELFQEILTGAGYRVIPAPDGAVGLELARAHRGEIDLLLTDVVMPNMLGPDLAHRLRDENPGLKVIFMSGHAQPVLGGAVALEPGTPLLQKPFMEAELLTMISEVLAGAHALTP